MKNHVTQAKAPPNRDFTGGMIPPASCSYVGSTGDKNLDEEILAMAEKISIDGNHCLLAEMMITGVRIACGGAVAGGDFKLMNRALKEMRVASEVFHPYLDRRKVSVFGSARTGRASLSDRGRICAPHEGRGFHDNYRSGSGNHGGG